MSKDKSPFQDDIFLRGARLRARQSADARELRHEAGLAESEEFFQALVAAVMLRKHRLAWLLAPAAMHLLVVRGHNVRDVEVLLGLFTAYAGFMVGLTREARLRGAYLLAGRVLFTAFATIVVADATESAAAASVALAGLVFIQIALHPIVRRRFDGCWMCCTRESISTARSHKRCTQTRPAPGSRSSGTCSARIPWEVIAADPPRGRRKCRGHGARHDR